jgi:di/tricarboxylate transporter
VILVIAAAFGLGRALQVSGASDLVAGKLIGLAGDNPWLCLVLTYGLTSLSTAVVTNNAAAVLFFPISISTAAKLGVDPMPFIASTMIAASASFISPIGYQTNLMVYGPGGYRFGDYMRVGLPLNLLFWVTVAVLAPVIWPF